MPAKGTISARWGASTAPRRRFDDVATARHFDEDTCVIKYDPRTKRLVQVAYYPSLIGFHAAWKGISMSADRSPIMPSEPNRLAQPIFGDTEACVLSSGALAAHLLHRYNAFAPVPGTHGATRFTGGLSPTDLSRVLALIHDQLDVNLSLAEMAQTVNVSPFHFSRLFRQSTGLAPHQYVIAQRVEAARSLLMRGELSAGQIAGHVGFASQSHLNRHFKRIYGVPPVAFARTNAFDHASHPESKNVQTDDNCVEDDSDLAPA
jgi:AraC-like DNA-binding protein